MSLQFNHNQWEIITRVRNWSTNDNISMNYKLHLLDVLTSHGDQHWQLQIACDSSYATNGILVIK